MLSGYPLLCGRRRNLFKAFQGAVDESNITQRAFAARVRQLKGVNKPPSQRRDSVTGEIGLRDLLHQDREEM